MSEAIVLKGQLKLKGEVQQVIDTFKKREFIIETDEQYKQCIGLELVQDKTSILDGYNVGDMIEVSINIRGRMGTGKWDQKAFNSLHAWRIQKVQGEATAEAPASGGNTNFDEDVPF